MKGDVDEVKFKEALSAWTNVLMEMRFLVG